MKTAAKRLAVVKDTKFYWTVVIYQSTGGNPTVTGRVAAAKKDFTFDELRTRLVKVNHVHSVVKG